MSRKVSRGAADQATPRLDDASVPLSDNGAAGRKGNAPAEAETQRSCLYDLARLHPEPLHFSYGQSTS
jgi:hypothetical protein